MLNPSRIFIALMFLFISFIAIYSSRDISCPVSPPEPSVDKYLVMDEPRISGTKQRIVVKSLKTRRLSEIQTNQSPDYFVGDILKISGAPIAICRDDPFINYYLSKKVIYVIKYPEISKVGMVSFHSRDAFVALRRPLINIRKYLSSNISLALAEPLAGLVNGIIFGERGNLSSDLNSAFSRTGLTHIIALSGYNITIVIAFLSIILNRGNRRLHSMLCISGIILFVFATGLSASVIRAAIMGSVFLLAGFWGRRPDGVVAILFAACMMVAFNQYLLLYDVGFQLSFTAMLGVILLVPIIDPAFKLLAGFFSPYLSATLAAQIFTWPIISAEFGLFSVVAPLSNLLVLPIIPITMLSGFLLAITKRVVPFLGDIFLYIVWFFSAYINKIAETLSAFSYASLPISIHSPALILGYYLIIFDFIMIFRRRKNV